MKTFLLFIILSNFSACAPLAENVYNTPELRQDYLQCKQIALLETQNAGLNGNPFNIIYVNNRIHECMSGR